MRKSASPRFVHRPLTVELRKNFVGDIRGTLLLYVFREVRAPKFQALFPGAPSLISVQPGESSFMALEN